MALCISTVPLVEYIPEIIMFLMSHTAPAAAIPVFRPEPAIFNSQARVLVTTQLTPLQVPQQQGLTLLYHQLLPYVPRFHLMGLV